MKAHKSEIIVGAEPTGHYWFGIAQSLKKSQIKLVLVNPFHVKRSKELDDYHPSKTDSKDPKTIAKLVIEGRYSVPYILEGIYAELRTGMLERARIIKELNMIKNRMERWFEIYFPEHKQVFSDFEGIGSMTVLEKAPLPKDILELGIDGINGLWRVKKVRAVGIKRATSLYNAAIRSIGVTEGLEMARFEIEIHLEDYRDKMNQYERIMLLIEELCSCIKGVDKVFEIKGIGLITIAGFLAEVGDIERFDSTKQIQKLAGLALKENSSGKHRGQTSISKRGRSRLIAITCKLIRVFFAILTKNEVYDSERLLNDIKRPEPLAA